MSYIKLIQQAFEYLPENKRLRLLFPSGDLADFFPDIDLARFRRFYDWLQTTVERSYSQGVVDAKEEMCAAFGVEPGTYYTNWAEFIRHVHQVSQRMAAERGTPVLTPVSSPPAKSLDRCTPLPTGSSET